MYAYIEDNEITKLAQIPNGAKRQDTGEWVLGLKDASTELQEATGWYEVVDEGKPDPSSETKVVDYSIDLVDGVPTRVYTERDKTQEEIDAENTPTLEQQIADLEAAIAILTGE